MELEVPGQFGRYRLEASLGKGAFGTVYKAWDTHLEAYVALKLPQLDGVDPQRRENILARFHREAKAAARLPPHSHICAVRDHGEIDEQPYVAMAYLEGRPLTQVRKPQPIRTTIRTVRRIARAMQVAHANNVIHRDLKPDNIMIVEGDQPVIMDFGLARRMDSEESLQTADGTVMGTPAYMSPEQARGVQSEIGPQSDVYSLGVIAYELLTGRRPFEAENVYALLTKIATETPGPPSRINPEIDSQLDAICLKAIARNRTVRYASMKELDEALEEYSEGRKRRPLSKPLLESVPRQPQRTADLTPEEIFPEIKESGKESPTPESAIEFGHFEGIDTDSIQFATAIEEKEIAKSAGRTLSTRGTPTAITHRTRGIHAAFRTRLEGFTEWNLKAVGVSLLCLVFAGILLAKLMPSKKEPVQTGKKSQLGISPESPVGEPKEEPEAPEVKAVSDNEKPQNPDISANLPPAPSGISEALALRIVRVDYRNVTFRNLRPELEEMLGFEIRYSLTNESALDKPISLDLSDATMQRILETSLGKIGLNYVVQGDHILVEEPPAIPIDPPRPQNTRPAMPVADIIYTTKDANPITSGMLLWYNAREQEWGTLPYRSKMIFGEQLACPEPFDAVFSIRNTDCEVTFIGGVLANFQDANPPSAFGLNLSQGKVLFTRSEGGAGRVTLRVNVGKDSLLLELVDPNSRCGLEVLPRLPNQLETSLGSNWYAGRLWVDSGRVDFTDRSGKRYKLAAKQALDVSPNEVAEGESAIPATAEVDQIMPDWLNPISRGFTSQTARDMRQIHSAFQEAGVESDVTTILLHLAKDDKMRPPVGIMAAKTLAMMGCLSDLADLLSVNDASPEEIRMATIEGIRRWLTLHPNKEHGQRLHDELLRNFQRETANRIYRLLWGYRKSDLMDTVRALELVDYLMDDNITVRTLAFIHLCELTGRSNNYRPLDSETQRKIAADRWRNEVLEGKLFD